MPFEIRAEPFALGTELFTFEQTRRDKALAHSFTPEPRMGSLTVPQNERLCSLRRILFENRASA
jgi:hypothetical protein